MKSVMPVSEFNGWMKYYAQKPPDVQELQMAVLCTIVSNAVGGKSKVDDFILSNKDANSNSSTSAITPEQVSSIFNALI